MPSQPAAHAREPDGPLASGYKGPEHSSALQAAGLPREEHYRSVQTTKDKEHWFCLF